MKRLIILIATVLATPSYAQNMNEATPPCVRGSGTVKLGGLDLDVLKCQLAVQNEMIANSAIQMSEMQARLRLMSQDLENARKAAEPKPAPPAAQDRLRQPTPSPSP